MYKSFAPKTYYTFILRNTLRAGCGDSQPAIPATEEMEISRITVPG
jgi:hypothetical protein